MAIDKIVYADVVDGVTDGYAAALLVNKNKQITNSVVDTVNSYGDAVEYDVGGGSNELVLNSALGTAARVDVGSGAGDLTTNTNVDNKISIAISGGDFGTAAFVDVGTGSTDIPTNADLGLAAFVDVGSDSDMKEGDSSVIPTSEQVRKNHTGQVESIAALQLLEPAFDGQQVELLGHTTAAIGGGKYFFNPSDLSSVVTSLNALSVTGAVVPPTSDSTGSSGAWVIDTHFIKPSHFGATFGFVQDATKFFNACTVYARWAGLSWCYADNGKQYRIDGTVSNGPLDDTSISWKGNGATLKFYGSGGWNIRNSGTKVLGFKATQDSAVTKSKQSIFDILDVSDVDFECKVYDTKSLALRIRADSNPVDSIRVKSTFRNNSGGDILVQGTSETNKVTGVDINHCFFTSTSDPYQPGATQIRAVHFPQYVYDSGVSDCILDGVADAGYTTGWRDAIMIGNSSATGQPDNIWVRGCNITGMSDDAVGISGAGLVTISNCELYGSPVTSGVYVPADGSWTVGKVIIDNVTSHSHNLAGIFLKDVIEYSISGGSIYDCAEGIHVVDAGSGAVVGGVIGGGLKIKNVAGTAINIPSGRVSICLVDIDGYGDEVSPSVVDKGGIFVADYFSGGSITGVSINNGIHAFVINGNPNHFNITGNTGRGNSGYVLYFIGFGGDNFIVANNAIQALSPTKNAPPGSATKVIANNLN